MATVEGTALRVRSGSIFFPVMAVAMALVVFAGFSRSFFLKSIFHAPPELSGLMVVHGLVFTTWIAILIAQTGLIAANRRDLHMRLGVLGVCVAALMVVLGSGLAVDALRRGVVPPGVPMSPTAFFAIPIGDMVPFAILIGLGIANRARPDFHKRYMILGTALLLDAAIARLPVSVVETYGPLAFFGFADLFILAMALYDFATRWRMHPATLWSGLIIVASQVLRMIVSGTAAWHAFAVWLGGPA